MNELTNTPAVGDFIEIPAWNVFGLVREVKPSTISHKPAFLMNLQEDPENEAENWYILEPDQYVIVESLTPKQRCAVLFACLCKSVT